MFRAIDKWLVGYLVSVLRRPKMSGKTRHLIFCLADHFEPMRDGASRERGRELVKNWIERYKKNIHPHRDADGNLPKRTLFYPAEEYDEQCLEMLAGLYRSGLVEVEIHLHHRNDTEEGVRKKLIDFRDILHEKHGLLGVRNGYPAYGFIHGNWALCNSRPDGDWCGVNNELGILLETGCYADFTFPSAPSPTQTKMVNLVYRATDSGRPRAADRGVRIVASSGQSEVSRRQRALMIITGPLGLDWGRRKWGIFPRLENSDLSGSNLPTARRADLWVKQGIHVAGVPDWIFVKIHTHGLVEGNAEIAGQAMTECLGYLESRYNDGTHWQLHYASAREMYNIVRAAEDGHIGSPGDFRDYEVTRQDFKEDLGSRHTGGQRSVVGDQRPRPQLSIKQS